MEKKGATVFEEEDDEEERKNDLTLVIHTHVSGDVVCLKRKTIKYVHV